METAIDFVRQHFKQGLCYPVWIDGEYSYDDEDIVTRTAGKYSSRNDMGLDNSLLSVESDKAYCSSSRNRGGNNTRDNRERTNSSSNAEESRDACPEMALLSSFREGEENPDIGDLDEVIAKIVRKRDQLIKEKRQADEEIKRLRLENENLRNLNKISKRITTKLKLDAENDKKTIRVLAKAFKELKIRTNDARHELDGSNFLSGISTCDGGAGQGGPMANVNAKIPASSSFVLDSVFGWTIGDEE